MTAIIFRRLIVIIGLLIFSMTLRAEVIIDINSGVDKATKIAVVPFRWDFYGKKSVHFDKIINEDLLRSGLFKTINSKSMLSYPYPGQDISYRDWRINGTEYIVTGLAESTPRGIELTVELFNVATQTKLLRRKLLGSFRHARELAHQVSDIVFEEITGMKGIFRTKLLYITEHAMWNKTKRYRLKMSDFDGEREFLIMESSQPIMSPVWAPDGKSIAYVTFENGRSSIYQQVLLTGKRTRLTNFRGINGAPAWSPDGKKMAMSLSRDGNPEIYILDTETEVFQRVTDHFSIDTEPSWTVDGKNLVFTSDRGGSPQIYQINLQSGRLKRLTYQGDYNASPQISRDGRYLVMVHRAQGRYHIAVQDLKLDRLLILTNSNLDESPTIAPNNAMVMYSTKHKESSILAVVSMDAGVRYMWPAQEGGARDPDWSPFLGN